MRGGGSAQDEAFRVFVEASQQRLVNFAEFLVGDLGRAEDLVQDALVQAYLKWPKIGDRNPEAYVRRCVVNGRADWWRLRSSREVPSNGTAGLSDRAGPGDTSADVDERLLVFAALSRLSVRERTVMVLRYYVGLSEADIAKETGVAPGTVKSTAARAAVKLRADPQLDEGVRHESR